MSFDVQVAACATGGVGLLMALHYLCVENNSSGFLMSVSSFSFIKVN